ncbi:response regulator transcription factor [Chamaesiphon sp. VAR_48_metabat_135_sub]|uniref:response regulator n=1 Tax=Chamaesiphon sp. VAR_48_metabat_135_sub TaxID=2964699 RepID=UPI00286CD576|nr:response regulator transcription factor [Chamaesiphon sp. VAR_48_metabat_135_sub]
MIRILLADDQKSIRERLKSLLETEADFDIVGMVDNGYDAIEQVKLLLPDVVLMDMEMPDLDGVFATKIISNSSLKTKILVLSSHDGDEYVAKSICAGANGYILKGAPAQEICDAVRFINLGYMQISPGLFEKFIPNKIGLGTLPMRDRIDYPGGLELTGINKRKSNSGFGRSSGSIVLWRSSKSVGRYQAIALILAGLGAVYCLSLLHHNFKKSVTKANHQNPSPQLQHKADRVKG